MALRGQRWPPFFLCSPTAATSLYSSDWQLPSRKGKMLLPWQQLMLHRHGYKLLANITPVHTNQLLVFRGHYTGYRIFECIYTYRHNREDDNDPGNSYCVSLLTHVLLSADKIPRKSTVSGHYSHWQQRFQFLIRDKQNTVYLTNRLTDNIPIMSFSVSFLHYFQYISSKNSFKQWDGKQTKQ